MQMDARGCRRVTGFNFGLHGHISLEVRRFEGQGLCVVLGVFLRLMFEMRGASDTCGIRHVVCSAWELVMLNPAYTTPCAECPI